jgi:hypothetical protein
MLVRKPCTCAQCINNVPQLENYRGSDFFGGESDKTLMNPSCSKISSLLAESSLPSAVTPTESMTSFGYDERVAYIASSGFILLATRKAL